MENDELLPEYQRILDEIMIRHKLKSHTKEAYMIAERELKRRMRRLTADERIRLKATEEYKRFKESGVKIKNEE